MDWRYPWYHDIDNFTIVKPSIEEIRYMMSDASAVNECISKSFKELYEKENDNMNKDYIIIHIDNDPMIIFKKYICSIIKGEDGGVIQTVSGRYFADESYADIVKQAL